MRRNDKPDAQIPVTLNEVKNRSFGGIQKSTRLASNSGSPHYVRPLPFSHIPIWIYRTYHHHLQLVAQRRARGRTAQSPRRNQRRQGRPSPGRARHNPSRSVRQAEPCYRPSLSTWWLCSSFYSRSVLGPSTSSLCRIRQHSNGPQTRRSDG